MLDYCDLRILTRIKFCELLLTLYCYYDLNLWISIDYDYCTLMKNSD